MESWGANRKHGPKPGPYCALPLPYPPVRVAKPDPEFAQKMMREYAGPDSEFTAIMDYLYQHHFFQESYPDFARTMECLARTEMVHLDMFGRTIFRLGGKPQFAYEGRGWNARNAFYPKDICAAIRHNMQGEMAAYRLYRRRARETDDPYIRRLYIRFALDERFHYRLMCRYLRRYCLGEKEE